MSEIAQQFDAELTKAIMNLEAYIEKESYRGYDPYDVLTSPIFKLPVLRSNKLVRFGAQQTFRRIPWNVRPFIGVPKGYNPVTLALCLQAYSYLSCVWQDKQREYERRIQFLLDELVRLQSVGYHGSCWGYDFDWEARYAKIPAFMPTVVATGIVTNALFENYRLTGTTKSFDLCLSAVEFVRNDLHRTFEEDTFCFSYSPVDTQNVLNASMKGARLLSQVYSITKDPALRNEAQQAVRFVLNHQRDNGSWPYAVGDARTWADGYHTAYVLDCLQAYKDLSGDERVGLALAKGLSFYKENFFINGTIPKYYSTKTYPLDSTCAAQAILTLSRFGELTLAAHVCSWVLRTMLDAGGFLYYQKHRLYTHRTSYMRWSNAWMFCAWAYLLYKRQCSMV